MKPHQRFARYTVSLGAASAALLSITFVPTPAVARTSVSSSRAVSLRQDVNALVAAGTPGVVVITRHAGRVTSLAGGLADVRTRTPMRAGDRFRIGSLTKTYVATIVLQLAAQGSLTLDDTVAHWLPGLVPGDASITIRQLLNHSSGIPDFDQDPRVLKPYQGGNLSYRWSPRALIKIAVSHKPLFAPGARYSYSNTNYLLAGLIVQAATGHTLAAELERRIFKPLHLDNTSFQTRPGLTDPYAHGYYVFDKPPATDISDLSPYPWAAGAIVASGVDVATFYHALLAGKLLPPGELAAMKTTLTEGPNTDLPDSRYGLGLESYRLPCGRAWGHGGNFPGYLVYSLTSNDAQRQAEILINEDPTSLPGHFAPHFFKLLDDAYCSPSSPA
jgi:D-alanyl-D-alanine carboxypeptidase